MSTEDHAARFAPFALKLKAEGATDERVQEVFKNYLACKRGNERDRQEKRIVWRFKA